jgi:hypothetical protein
VSTLTIVGIVFAALMAIFIIYCIIDERKNNRAKKEFIDDLKTTQGFDFVYEVMETQAKKIDSFLLNNTTKK